MKETRWGRSRSIMDLHLAKRSGGTNTAGGLRSTANSSFSGAPGTSSSSTREHQNSSSGTSASAQPYELIKSTQSLVERLHLNAEDITIQPVHPSIIGQDTWFQITYTSSGATRYFSCQSPKERDEWISSLKKTLMLNVDRRRTDNSLRLDVLEIKGLPDNSKKKFYAEIMVDDKLYARTSAKKVTRDQCCFWGEQFEFKDLPQNADKIGLLIHKEKNCGGVSGKRKKPKNPVGRVKISICSVKSRYLQDKWYAVEKTSRREAPSIRLRCQFNSVDILPLRDYEEFLYFLRDEYKVLCRLLEPNISVKVKEELSTSLMNVFHAEEMAEDVLADIVVDEISSVENEHLTFRGNSIATKAMESYIKLVGHKYLRDTLHSVLEELIASDIDLEVDPVKVTAAFSSNTGSSAAAAEALALNRTNLTRVVKQVWYRIASSHSYFPITLQRCFYKIRQYLQHVGKPEVGDNLISACIFLRYLCPAILAPSLFNLTDEYPNEKANRRLTLVAKTLQTLANFTRYEGKENSMEFLNPFLQEESEPMKTFLRRISSPLAEDGWIPTLSSPVEKNDLGRHLSCLHTILFENISKVPADHPKAIRLRQLLDDVSAVLNRPTIPELEQISQPTLKTLKKIRSGSGDDESSSGLAVNGVSSADGSSEKASSFAGITLPWIGTLPKKTKSNGTGGTNMSHPAPHHEVSKVGIFVRSSRQASKTSGSATLVAAGTQGRVGFASGASEGISMSSETSSDSTSLTPSPGATFKDTRGPDWFNGRTSIDCIDEGGIQVQRPLLYSGYVQHHRNVASKPSTLPFVSPSLPQQKRRTSSKLFCNSSMSLDETETDSSDDSSYSSQYQSDATNSTTSPRSASTLPRQLIGVGGHLPGTYSTSFYSPNHHHHLPLLHVSQNVQEEVSTSQSLSGYEREILSLRSAMEQLQIKLGEAESKLQAQQQKRHCTESATNSMPKCQTGVHDAGVQQYETRVAAAELEAKRIVGRLLKEEDLLRRGPLLDPGNLRMEDKERMIRMQQQKIAALDEANNRLVEELNRLGDQLKRDEDEEQQKLSGPCMTTFPVNMTTTTSPASSFSPPDNSIRGTAVNASSDSTSPRPSCSPSDGSASRRFGSPSSTISSSSLTSSNSGHPQINPNKLASNRSVMVISNGQTSFPSATPTSSKCETNDGEVTLTFSTAPSDPCCDARLTSAATKSVQETPKTVDELLDSLHSTPI